MTGSRPLRSALIWAGLAAAAIIPIVIAAGSPLLAWRDSIYIVAGFAGLVALTLLLIQPLLSGAYLPGLRLRFGRRLHAWVGGGIVLAVVVHVGALWLTSPPDVADALLFDSPTPFSIWGVVAMWAVFATALLAALRGRVRLILCVQPGWGAGWRTRGLLPRCKASVEGASGPCLRSDAYNPGAHWRRVFPPSMTAGARQSPFSE